MLQQYLPFTVLKQDAPSTSIRQGLLQQYLPFTVLKLPRLREMLTNRAVATVLTVYGIET